MSNFSARVIADLDTSKIPSQLKDITKKHPLVLNNFTLNTKGLPSQIQAVLDSHKFTIHLGNIKGENIESQLGRLGGKASEAGMATHFAPWDRLRAVHPLPWCFGWGDVSRYPYP